MDDNVNDVELISENITWTLCSIPMGEEEGRFCLSLESSSFVGREDSRGMFVVMLPALLRATIRSRSLEEQLMGDYLLMNGC
jgi:hypothetical protein